MLVMQPVIKHQVEVMADIIFGVIDFTKLRFECTVSVQINALDHMRVGIRYPAGDDTGGAPEQCFNSPGQAGSGTIIISGIIDVLGGIQIQQIEIGFVISFSLHLIPVTGSMADAGNVVNGALGVQIVGYRMPEIYGPQQGPLFVGGKKELGVKADTPGDGGLVPEPVSYISPEIEPGSVGTGIIIYSPAEPEFQQRARRPGILQIAAEKEGTIPVIQQLDPIIAKRRPEPELLILQPCLQGIGRRYIPAELL